jgi:hypothetical protein
MKRTLAVLMILGAALLAQAPLSQLYTLMWDSGAGRYAWIQFRNGFTRSGNFIDVTPATPVLPIPVRGLPLVFNATSKGYTLPDDAPLASVQVLVNGIAYFPPKDYTLVGRVVVPFCTAGAVDCNWPPGGDVRVSYEH